MITGKIHFAGKTIEGVREAVEEALNRIEQGNTSGHDVNDSGAFIFDVDHEAGVGTLDESGLGR